MWYDAPPAHDERDARCLNRNATAQVNEFSTLYKQAKKSQNPELEIAANELRLELENFNGFLIAEIQLYDIMVQHHIVSAMSKLQKIILECPKFEIRPENYANEKGENDENGGEDAEEQHHHREGARVAGVEDVVRRPR